MSGKSYAVCLMNNCRKRAPADEAFCAEHRNNTPSKPMSMVDTNAVIDLIAEAISDSLGPDWTAFDAAHHVMQWLADEGLCIVKTRSGVKPGSNEWLMQSPLFHPGDLA